MHRTMSLTRWSASVLLLAVGLANAAPVPSDLTIGASVSLDTLNSLAAEGGATQSAAITLVGGGAAQSASFVDDPATIAPADNFAGPLTQTGDGLFATARMSGSGDGATTPGLFIDFSIDISNGSATDSFEVFFRFGALNSVFATGDDAYVWSEFAVDGNVPDLFYTDYEADTIYGDQQLDGGNTSFSVILAPGGSYSLTALLAQEGVAFAGNPAYGADLAVDIELLRVAVLGEPPGPNPMPLPGTLPLLGLGLALLATGRRRAAR